MTNCEIRNAGIANTRSSDAPQTSIALMLVIESATMSVCSRTCRSSSTKPGTRHKLWVFFFSKMARWTATPDIPKRVKSVDGANAQFDV